MQRKLLIAGAVCLVIWIKRRRAGREEAALRARRIGLLILVVRCRLLRAKHVEVFRYRRRSPCFADYSEADCTTLFRFRKGDLPRLQAALGITEVIHTDNGSVYEPECALVYLLKRMAYATRLQDLRQEFGRDTTQLSRLHIKLVDRLYARFGYILEDGLAAWTAFFPSWAKAITDKTGAPAGRDNVVGFVDGTVRPICRPGDLLGPGTDVQREVYNGHKRIHALKYQGTVAPNGMVIDLSGPYAGRRHDAYLLNR
jgi:hypothetical protein